MTPDTDTAIGLSGGPGAGDAWADGLAARHLPGFTPRHVHLRPGVRLAYLDEGSGPPVVMVHGNPTWSFFYRDLVRGLRDTHRCIVPDHVGCGLSSRPDDRAYRYTLDSRVDDLDALLGHLGLEGVTLVVHDWGGMIGSAWAVRRPERVNRLVVLNTGLSLLPPGKSLPWQIAVVRNTPLGPLLVRGLNLFCRGLVSTCSVRKLDPEARAGYLAPYDTWGRRRAVLRFVEDIPLRPGDPAYATVQGVTAGVGKLARVPTLICWGDRDFVFDHHFLAGWQAAFPAASVHRFPDAAHLVLDDAGERILPLVREFLGRPGAP